MKRLNVGVQNNDMKGTVTFYLKCKRIYSSKTCPSNISWIFVMFRFNVFHIKCNIQTVLCDIILFIYVLIFICITNRTL